MQHITGMVKSEVKVEKTITLAHGSGGWLMHELIDSLRLKFSNKILDEMADAAELKVNKNRLAFSTDSYVIKPLFFPGGDIGKLAVCGTVNDISMKGAKPLFLSLAFILEEGLECFLVQRFDEAVFIHSPRPAIVQNQYMKLSGRTSLELHDRIRVVRQKLDIDLTVVFFSKWIQDRIRIVPVPYK